MKLVSLYIENFGGLSQYALDFSEGLTVLQEPNGFGKTTLAEFIRAMFYGFPRKAKTLDKSKRQKYTPWNGGKCGGHLTFQLEGDCYRIERTFGATPRGDTFRLIDLKTGRKSDRFSEEIGVELFGLDADSFERSTYMPQLHDSAPLTTDSIRAKLGDLVEDTNDVGNFDKAMNALRAKRSALVPYRGGSGAVAEAKTKISYLQDELDRTEAQREALAACREDIARIEAEQKSNQEAVDQARHQIRLASEAAAVAAAHKQFDDLTGQQQQLQGELARLGEQYPKGLPEAAQIEAVRQTADRAALLSQQKVTDREDQDAAAFLDANRGRFENRVPTAEELEACRGWCNEYRTLRTEAENTGLSDGEKAQYEKLLPLFESGALSEEVLEKAAEGNRNLLKKRHEWESLTLSESEQGQLCTLEAYFAPGLPGEEEILSRRQDLAELQPLRQENDWLASQLPAQPRKSSPAPAILLLLLGALGITLGVVLLVKQQFVLGGVGLGVGVLALLGAIIGCMKLMVSRELSASARTEQGRREANQARMAVLEQAVGSFTARYTDTQPLADALREMQKNREDLLALSARRDALFTRRQQAAEEIRQLEAPLRRALGEGDFDQAILNRRLAREQFLSLREKTRASQAKKEALLAQSGQYQAQAAEFLGQFYADVQPENFHSLLSQLQRDSEAYSRAEIRVAQWQQRKTQHDRETAECAQELAAFFESVGLTAAENVPNQLMQMRDDRKSYEDISARLERLKREMAAFAAEHEKQLAQPIAADGPDAEEWKNREARLTEEATALTKELLEQRQRERSLREQIDRIPALRDELERWQAEKNDGQRKAQTLDDTMEFLEKARESLAFSYLGPIRRGFAGYLNRLAGEQGEKILVTPDLEVKLERLGQARELAFFSAGQTDMVMLCMRLALVDALFTGEKPFVILDDPFVNLDDRHTAEALKLLQELAQERQILYLVCNSSRSIQ